MAEEKDLKTLDIETIDTQDVNKDVKQEEPKLTKEEQEEKQKALIEEFMKKNTKELDVPELSESFKKDAILVLKELDKAKLEIDEKISSFVGMYRTIEKKLENLVTGKKIQLNDQDYQKVKESFLRYEKFLNQVLAEVVKELGFYAGILAEKPLEKIVVFKDVSDDAVSFLNDKLKTTKRYLKKMYKDLRISYSRYFVDLQDQIRRLDYLEQHTKVIKKDK